MYVFTYAYYGLSLVWAGVHACSSAPDMWFLTTRVRALRLHTYVRMLEPHAALAGTTCVRKRLRD